MPARNPPRAAVTMPVTITLIFIMSKSACSGMNMQATHSLLLLLSLYTLLPKNFSLTLLYTASKYTPYILCFCLMALCKDVWCNMGHVWFLRRCCVAPSRKCGTVCCARYLMLYILYSIQRLRRVRETLRPLVFPSKTQFSLMRDSWFNFVCISECMGRCTILAHVHVCHRFCDSIVIQA